MSNLNVLDAPILSPGRCLRCSDYKGPVVDLGIDGWDGRVYLCFRCVDSITAVRGGATPEQLARFEALLEDANDKITTLKAEKAEARREFVAEMADKMLERKPEVPA